MALKALLCDSAASAAGRLHVLAAWDSYVLRGPRKGLRGTIAGVVSELDSDRVGQRVQVRARLGTTDGTDADSWKAVKVGGRPVQAQTSAQVERPSESSGGSPVSVPFVLELPSVDLGRRIYMWRVSGAGFGTDLPFHQTFEGDIDALPDGDLFLCEAATVAERRLYMLGARSHDVLGPRDTERWTLAGRLSKPTAAGSGVERVEVTAVLRDSGSDELQRVTQTVEVPRPPKGRYQDWAFVEVPVALTLPPQKLGKGDYGWSVDAGDSFEYVQFSVR